MSVPLAVYAVTRAQYAPRWLRGSSISNAMRSSRNTELSTECRDGHSLK